MSFDPNPTIEVSGVRKVGTIDLSAEDLLYEISKKLDVLIMHMSKLTDETIGDV